VTATLSLTGAQHRILDAHLRGAPERVAFAVAAAGAPGHVVVSDVLLVDDAFLEPGPWCVQLTDEAQQQILMWATANSGWVIEMHSHIGPLGDPACFSPTDIEALATWVPHIRWRLQARPYMAIVVGPKTIDGVAWTGKPGEVESIKTLLVDGTSTAMTGLSWARISEVRT